MSDQSVLENVPGTEINSSACKAVFDSLHDACELSIKAQTIVQWCAANLLEIAIGLLAEATETGNYVFSSRSNAAD